MSGTARTTWATTVLFPEPEGPETTKSWPCPAPTAHSTFCTCSRRRSIWALISRPSRVISSPSAWSPEVFERMVLVSRFISWRRKSSCLPRVPSESSRWANCWAWLARRVSSSLTSLRSAGGGAGGARGLFAAVAALGGVGGLRGEPRGVERDLAEQLLQALGEPLVVSGQGAAPPARRASLPLPPPPPPPHLAP